MTESPVSTGPSPIVSDKPFAREAEYWDARYNGGGLSGDGSYGEVLAKKLAALKDLEFKTVTEIGCGDFNLGKNIIFQHKLNWEDYYALDISEKIIERNKGFYPKAKFEVFTNGMKVPQSDLTLCTDVLFHIYDDKNYEELLTLLKGLWKKYLVVTAYEREPKEGENKGHIHIRKFDPAFFGVPKIREVCEEDGQMMIYVFEKEPAQNAQ